MALLQSKVTFLNIKVSTIFYNHYNYVQDYIMTDIDCISYGRFGNI